MEQIKQRWRSGDYTASGYLAAIFSEMEEVGQPIAIRSVSEFCQTWEINERVFYRAKAKLINQGRLEETIRSPLIIHLPEDVAAS